ncbi:hypothetical protein LguiB_013146 [Lonicera macranthoides]
MERKQGFFSASKDEVVQGLSTSRSQAKSSARNASPKSGQPVRQPKGVDFEIREHGAVGGDIDSVNGRSGSEWGRGRCL